MGVNQNTVGLISAEVAIAISPVSTVFSSTEKFNAFLLAAGWDAGAIISTPASLQQLAANAGELFDTIEKFVNGDELTAAEITAIIQAVRNTIRAIEDIRNAADVPSQLEANGFKDEFPAQLLQITLVNYLLTRAPVLIHLLGVMGLYTEKRIPLTGNRPAYINRTIKFSELPELFSAPLSGIRNTFGWGTADFQPAELFSHLRNLMVTLGQQVFIEKFNAELAAKLGENLQGTDEEPAFLDVLNFSIFSLTNETGRLNAGIKMFAASATATSLPGLVWIPYASGSFENEIPVSNNLFFRIRSDLDMNGGVALIVRPGEDLQVVTGFDGPSNPSHVTGSVRFDMLYKDPQALPVILIGSEDGSRIAFQSAMLSLFVELDSHSKQNLAFEIGIKEGAIVIDTSNSDSFLKHILPAGGINANFDVTLGWSSIKGVYFNGSGGLELNIPVHVSIGPIQFSSIDVSITPSAKHIPLKAGANITCKLDPLVIVVQGIGITADFSFPGSGGNLGPVDIGVGFKAPNGLGLSVDSGGLKGGGFLKIDQEKGEYFGALELEFNELFSLKAFGIVNTKMPDGSEGFSLLILITAEFTPVQLGFGFTLNGVGGLLGLNRTARLDILREGVRTNAIKSILFPEDIIGNIDRIVSDVKAVFPVQRDNFVICPMGKFGWGTPAIITLEVGLLLEIPVTGFAILGVLKAVLPQEDVPLLKLQINFIGIIDFENRTISFDGTLYDSRLLAYTLSGDMAFRLSYGDNPLFVLSVGGFHPAFREAPSDLQHMQRLTISLLNTANARIMVQTYFAVTSNTVQNGARAELFAGSAGGFNILGHIGYDVLFQFEPFHLVADFSAGLALRRGTSVLMGISASGQLSGPSPWDAHGRASISLFFFSVSVSFHETWGDTVSVPPAVIADVTQMLSDALQQESNWKAALPSYNKLQVTVRTITSARTVVHPFGILTFSQRIVPLNINIEKFGNQQPDTKFFAIKTSDEALKTEEASESFAPANFFNLKDADKLSRPSFEPMSSGFRITDSSQLQAPLPVNKSVNYEISYLGKRRTRWHRGGLYGFAGSLLSQAVKASSASRSSLSAMGNRISVNRPEEVLVPHTKYAVASTIDMKLYGQQYMAASYTEAMDHYNKIVNSNPAMAEQLQVVADYEINNN